MTVNSYIVNQLSLSLVTGSILVHFNGLVSTEIDQHSYSSTGVPAERQVRLNSVPHRVVD